MYKCFVPKKFSASSLEIIDQANDIIDEYTNDGYMLTLRQLYYQFVARDLIANTQQSYKRLGSIINDGRLAGLVSWEAMEDRTRNLDAPSTWTSPESILRTASRSYREDKWSLDAGQIYRPEVWVEKEALAGVVEQICEDLEVPFLACRGYMSQSEMWVSAQRMREHDEDGQIPVVIHLGDHDPSGIDMTRDNMERLRMLSEVNDIEVNRIALNMDQIEEFSPPPNPAKLTDSRASEYVQRFGYESWELDALEPSILKRLITEAVDMYKNHGPWERAVEKQEKNREWLRNVRRD